MSIKLSGFQKLTLLDYPGETACIVFTPGCNFKCPFCHNPGLVENRIPETYTDKEVIEYLQKRKGIITGICISGGEPTLQGADLRSFLEKLRKHTDVKIKLDTNGTHSTLLRNLINDKLIDYVAMDIKSGTHHYRKVSGITKLPNETTFRYVGNVRRSIDILLKSSIDYEFRTTVVGGLHTDEDFKNIRELIQGAKKYFIQPYKDSGDILLKRNNFTTPSNEDLERYKDIVKDYVEFVYIR